MTQAYSPSPIEFRISVGVPLNWTFFRDFKKLRRALCHFEAVRLTKFLVACALLGKCAVSHGQEADIGRTELGVGTSRC